MRQEAKVLQQKLSNDNQKEDVFSIENRIW